MCGPGRATEPMHGSGLAITHAVWERKPALRQPEARILAQSRNTTRPDGTASSCLRGLHNAAGRGPRAEEKSRRGPVGQQQLLQHVRLQHNAAHGGRLAKPRVIAHLITTTLVRLKGARAVATKAKHARSGKGLPRLIKTPKGHRGLFQG